MKIRDAQPDDLRALSWCAYHSKAHWGYDEAFMAACVDELTIRPEHLATHVLRVAPRGSEVAGFHGVVLDGDDSELEWLFVAPDAMGHGIGRALLGDACAIARHAGVRQLRIESDPFARAFYERCGAVCVGEVASASIPGRVLPLLTLGVS
ncbi:MAG TPA: GNAT family N-acetyltransferase [Acidimicrobiia bacterium]|nr:GNAT family N-acetyltransferase [Acidimicrobiia bacterium]